MSQPSVCFQCHAPFYGPNAERALWKHIAQAHNSAEKAPRIYRCMVCKRDFNRRQYLKRHQIHVHGVRAFQCSKCARTFRTELSLKIHASIMHNMAVNGQLIAKNLYPCPTCNMIFGIPEALQRHSQYCRNKIRIPSGPMRKRHQAARQKIDTTCTFCGNPFASFQTLSKHIARKHPAYVREFAESGKKWEEFGEEHMKYKCDACNKRMTTRAALTLHVKRTHMNIREHVCTQCGKSFPLASELKKHWLAHKSREALKTEQEIVEMLRKRREAKMAEVKAEAGESTAGPTTSSETAELGT